MFKRLNEYINRRLIEHIKKKNPPPKPIMMSPEEAEEFKKMFTGQPKQDLTYYPTKSKRAANIAAKALFFNKNYHNALWNIVHLSYPNLKTKNELHKIVSCEGEKS
ncbi:hypothetical protein IC620_15450 [Hazenella sp. IB182357]|uniref:Uncharacterized protein n=1 Tax=Polycladospora coralii TaxID=2771432 RepID=A0A926RYR0_9BACL|nr:hypothetical protein [Polycladospora coralii]MBD1373741.1 hypothetical protein [Polycladospora coralii]